MEVGVEYSQKTSVVVEYFVSIYVLVVNGDLRILLEGDAIEAGSQAEYTFLHVLQFEVGTKHFVVDVEGTVFQLLRIITPVPRHQNEIFTLFFTGQRLHLCIFLQSRRLVGLKQLAKQVIDVCAVLGHAAFQFVGGIVLVSQQSGYFQTRIDQLLDDVQVIVVIRVRTFRIVGYVELSP